MLKVQFRNVLDVAYPNFDKLYEDMYKDIPMTIIKLNPHPEKLLQKRVETIAKQLEKHSSHRSKYCLLEAGKIKAYVTNIQSGVSLNSSEVQILSSLIDELKNKEIEIKVHLENMIKSATQLQLFKQLQTIPGIGENLAVRLIAEIGDINRFENKRQLVAYAGIDPRVYQSGQTTGDHLHITKKGNKHLRTLLYLAVGFSIRSKKKTSIHDFYNKKRQQTNPLSHKAALIACANKLLRIIYSMSENGTTFEI